MKQGTVWLSRASVALGIAMTLGVGSAAAATPSSSMKALPEQTNTKTVTVAYVSSGDGGEISKVDLYAKKDDGAFQLIATTYDAGTPFIVDFSTLGGDGRYAFHTIAYLKNGTPTTTDDPAEVGKDLLEETVTIVDTVAPPAPDTNHIYINQSASLNSNEISGYAAAVEGSSRVEVYANPELTGLLAATTANVNGSFGPVSVGDPAMYPYVWVVAVDANGNRSVATMRMNELSYPYRVTNLAVTPVSETQLDVTFTAPSGAREYVVYYRHAGGAVWSAEVRTADTTVHLTGLEAGRAYDVRVAPVDPSNSVGEYVFASARTNGTPLHDVVLASEAVAVGGSTENPVPTVVVSATTTTTTADTAANTATSAAVAAPDTTNTTTPATVSDQSTSDQSAPADATAVDGQQPATDQAAEGEAATDENQPSSATPWVILAILIILAGIATGGYFYWFSGPEEVTTDLSATETKKEDEKKEEKKDDEADKRW